MKKQPFQFNNIHYPIKALLGKTCIITIFNNIHYPIKALLGKTCIITIFNNIHYPIKALLLIIISNLPLIYANSTTYASPTHLPSILIRSVKTTSTEFSAYAETEPVKTYAQHQLDNKRKQPRPVKLQPLLKQAQMDFVSYDPNQSKKKFQLITEQIHSFDWNTEERKIIFYSLLRLAQLEKNLQKQKLLLQEAIVFGMDLKLDSQLFPPPLVKLYFQQKKSAVFVSLDLNKIFPQHEIVLVNGKLYSNRQKIKLPYGIYRISAFSSSHINWSQVMSLSQLISKKINTSPLISGSCQKPTFNELNKISSSVKNTSTIKSHQKIQSPQDKETLGLKTNSVRILFPNFCVWSSMQHSLVNTKDPVFSSVAENLTEPEKSTQWIESEWIWLGAALIVGASTIFLLSGDKETTQQEKKKKPTIKIGF